MRGIDFCRLACYNFSMLVGLTTRSLNGECETEQALKLSDDTIAEVCEITLRTFYEYRPEFEKKYADRLGKVRAFSVRVAPYNFEPQLFDASRRTSGDGFYWLDQVLRSAALFKVKEYIFNGDALINEGFGLEQIAEKLCKISSFCLRSGIRMNIENGERGLFSEPCNISRVLSLCPDIGAALDLGKARKAGYPYTMYLAAMRGRLTQVRVSDLSADGKTCLPGYGIYDINEICRVLKLYDFDGPLFADSENFASFENIKLALEHIKKSI